MMTDWQFLIVHQLVQGVDLNCIYVQARKDGDMRNVERRAVNARYLAELVKFQCMPCGAFFVLLKVRSTPHNLQSAFLLQAAIALQVRQTCL